MTLRNIHKVSTQHLHQGGNTMGLLVSVVASVYIAPNLKYLPIFATTKLWDMAEASVSYPIQSHVSGLRSLGYIYFLQNLILCTPCADPHTHPIDLPVSYRFPIFLPRTISLQRIKISELVKFQNIYGEFIFGVKYGCFTNCACHNIEM